MLTSASANYKEDYEILQVFDGEMHNGMSTYTYLIRERHTNRLALLTDCLILDEETFTREDFDECAQLVADYTK
jgi:hypothetical protein